MVSNDFLAHLHTAEEVLLEINALAREDVANGVCRLSTNEYPVESTFEVQINCCRIGVRIVSTNLLCETTITWCIRISDNDRIESVVLSTMTLQSNSCCLCGRNVLDKPPWVNKMMI